MSWVPEEILIVCCHVKRNLFFEDSIRRLWNAGFHRIWLQQTGTNNFGSYHGPYEYYWPAPHDGVCAWETGLKCLHSHTQKDNAWKYLFLADFDLFFLDTQEFIECVNQVVEGEYDHVSRFKDRNFQSKYDFNGNQIIEVKDVKFYNCGTEADIPRIEPHFAIGYEFFSRRLWSSCDDHSLSDGRRLYREAIKMNLKMGAHFANYGLGEECWGKEWFHVSNLTYFFHMVDGICPLALDPTKFDHIYRIGFFAAQEECYGDQIYPLKIQESLNHIYSLMGGKQKCLDAWHQEITGKPMENWRKHD